ncbi:protocatechuate 3,4-dioxygenase [Rhizobium leguminosarum bv. viciae]|nr:protocatechuate 3,4-dioxygenase [Rhizobium leguminosarum bv. viciae]
MKRRTVVLQGAAMLASTIVALPFARKGMTQSIPGRLHDRPLSDLISGGTAGVPDTLPAPVFRAKPQCAVTLNKMLGPCHTNDVPIRDDVTEGVTGLPMRVSLRVVEAAGCKPIENADVEIWHADVRGVYSGRTAGMCNPDDEAARNAGFLRGRQITDADGVANFLTVYPGWYGGRAPHIHLRVLIDSHELLISQLLFDDALNDMIYGQHADYANRPPRGTTNDRDFVFSRSEVERFTFDVQTLDIGILQASYTIGLATRT